MIKLLMLILLVFFVFLIYSLLKISGDSDERSGLK